MIDFSALSSIMYWRNEMKKITNNDNNKIFHPATSRVNIKMAYEKTRQGEKLEHILVYI